MFRVTHEDDAGPAGFRSLRGFLEIAGLEGQAAHSGQVIMVPGHQQAAAQCFGAYAYVQEAIECTVQS